MPLLRPLILASMFPTHHRLTKVRDMAGHSARVSSLSWNGNMISSGARDSMILHHDVRQARRLPFTYVGHQQEICGLAWSPDGRILVRHSI